MSVNPMGEATGMSENEKALDDVQAKLIALCEEQAADLEKKASAFAEKSQRARVLAMQIRANSIGLVLKAVGVPEGMAPQLVRGENGRVRAVRFVDPPKEEAHDRGENGRVRAVRFVDPPKEEAHEHGA